jgi:hypothetical protein
VRYRLDMGRGGELAGVISVARISLYGVTPWVSSFPMQHTAGKAIALRARYFCPHHRRSRCLVPPSLSCRCQTPGPRSGLPVGQGALVGLEAKRSWGPPAIMRPRSGLPVGPGALVGLEAKRSWGPPAIMRPRSGLPVGPGALVGLEAKRSWGPPAITSLVLRCHAS